MLTYVNGLNILGLSTGHTGGHDSAYSWANRPMATTSYQPETSYQFVNTTNTGAIGSRASVGTYGMWFPNVDFNQGDVQVTAYGTGPEYCNVAGWSSRMGAQVRCYNTSGAPVDTYYDVAFTGPFVAG
jgi:hypothetical protein